MKSIINEDFLLNSNTARKIFHEYSEKLPIIDYHCHINPQEIYEDKPYENISQIWLAHDHYKWRVMRICGIDEENITGKGSDYSKFRSFAKALELSIGNPLYHWSHMELKKYFGFDEILSEKSADTAWDVCNKSIEEKKLSPRKIISQSNVEIICTTDDPIDDLKWHKLLREEKSFTTKVFPTWRPDKAINIEDKKFSSYIGGLGDVSHIEIKGFDSLKESLTKRIEYFAENGCCISDHGLDYVPYMNFTDEEVESAFVRRLNGEVISTDDAEKYKTALMTFLAEEYKKYNWVMQLHYGCTRNINTNGFKKLGADSGYDCMAGYTLTEKLVKFMDYVDVKCGLPKTIIYSLNPNDNEQIDSIVSSFQESGIKAKIQHGSAWWFNDTKIGMEKQLESLAANGVLGTFVGMLTDSRSFLSYARHDYFRRVVSNMIGKWVEGGEFPADDELLGNIIKNISYLNTKDYFGF